jgi:MFS family permease
MRVPRRFIYTPVIVPMLLVACLMQIVIPLARVATTYRALDLGLDAAYIGLLSAAFALLPVLLSVAIGRFNDEGRAGFVTLAGGLGLVVACAFLMLVPPTLPTLLLGTAMLGIGHTATLSSIQMLSATSSTKANRDTILGNATVAMSLGQVIGPLFIGLPEIGGARAGTSMLLVALSGAVLLAAMAALLARRSPQPHRRAGRARVSIREVAATRGMWWIILAGGLCITTQDILLTFLPVLGLERAIAPASIGLLLSIRGAAAMLSRVCFSRLVRLFGRNRLMLVCLAAAAIATGLLAAPVPFWVMILACCLAGFGLGIGVTCSISITIELAPRPARGTALSMRLTANRAGQFFIPALSGLLGASLGVGGIFALTAASLMATVATTPRVLRGGAKG